jgi:hypothetical protein
MITRPCACLQMAHTPRYQHLRLAAHDLACWAAACCLPNSGFCKVPETSCMLLTSLSCPALDSRNMSMTNECHSQAKHASLEVVLYYASVPPSLGVCLAHRRWGVAEAGGKQQLEDCITVRPDECGAF